jgi:glycosyltransferase involved in cell wall biosynthesis
MSRRFQYFAFIDSEQSPGVAKKVNNTVDAARNLGFRATSNLYNASVKEAIRLVVDLFKARADIIFIRFSLLLAPVLFFPMLWLRMKGKKLVVDVPTPRAVVLEEYNTSITNPLKRVVKQAISLLSSSWVLFPASLVVQYADESTWFSFGVKRKTLKLGNGILVSDNLPLCGSPSSRALGELRLIAVGQLADWHGYDRLIRAIHSAKQNSDARITLTIVGGGDALDGLVELVKELELESHVFFTGFLHGEALNQAFLNADMGVSSLGLYRKGLNEASDLKTREYITRGLAVIGAGTDPDFSQNAEPYRYTVSNTDNITELSELLVNLAQKHLLPATELREFALQHLSMESKIEKICKQINI